MDDLSIVFDPLPGDAVTRFLSDQVLGHNFARTGVSAWHPVGFFLKNPAGEWLGGLTGYVWGPWLNVEFLWVTEFLRGQGHGSRLLRQAEDFAASRGATGATLQTHSFQAPSFYEKQGYEVFGQLEDYPTGHTKLFLRKRFTQTMLARSTGTPTAPAIPE
jgi:GNAT superfamily N-acetyltransferase